MANTVIVERPQRWDEPFDAQAYVPAVVFFARQANVAYDTNQASTWNQGSETGLPDLVQFIQELLIWLYFSNR